VFYIEWWLEGPDQLALNLQARCTMMDGANKRENDKPVCSKVLHEAMHLLQPLPPASAIIHVLKVSLPEIAGLTEVKHASQLGNNNVNTWLLIHIRKVLQKLLLA
jgi:hypothetical protein